MIQSILYSNRYTQLVGTALVGASLLAGCGGSGDGSASHALPSVTELTAACAALVGKTVAGVTVTATQRFEAVADVSPTGFCKVSGHRWPFLDIEVDLPDKWTGRLFHEGGGGFDGTIPTAVTLGSAGELKTLDARVAQKGGVYVASNGGNRAAVPAEAAPGVWAAGGEAGKASAADYAYVALGTSMQFAKAVTSSFYQSPVTRSYFTGCSNGGRNAYIVAQRWPGEYDGIVSGCETMDMTGQTIAWLNIGARAGTPAALTAAQYSASYKAAVAACDAKDGVVDGYIVNAAACHYDPALLQCGLSTASPDAALCLSAPQVATLKDLMSPLYLSDGTLVYSAFNWSDFSTFGPSFGSLGGGYAMLANDDPSWLTQARQNAFDKDVDYPKVKEGLRKIGADNDIPAIAAYVASGKKLISWHAQGDNLLSANDHARNYARMTALVTAAGRDPAQGTRLFTVPSNTHGQGKVGVDWASAIVDWVEKDQAPSQLSYSFTQAGASAARSLPVCLSPKMPVYLGSGDPSAAASYRCE